MNKGEIILYDDKPSIEIRLYDDTIWLNQKQMAELFDRDSDTIGLHLKNIFSSKELDKKATTEKYSVVQKEGNRQVRRNVLFYNLDAIISVGYRVNSKRGTQFRIWANSVLKEYLVKGYVINEKRLAQKEEEIQILKNGISILGRAIEEKSNDNNEWLRQFAKGLELLDDYDHESLDKKGLTKKKTTYPSLGEYQKLVEQMRKEFDSDVFGKEKDKNFQSSLAQIEKGFGTKDFYPTIEGKAATLLYLITKNHSFIDGNKRIAAACFLKFLSANNMLVSRKGKPIISNDTLASLTLFIASSKPEEMETVKQLVISVLNRNR
ncbi:virulence RhuM family protein [Muricauda sp. SCSIO 64092]|uniref:RhuM family protein n=1 Tax=Allomuricauda sp. SCSIO 64092 TaxID=2908842 RepID=UPI001FF275B4|nr:RhuM family protein [Muricauda sp. SCSIO 64092]UOY06692.1 virulence RhuM family protein [Muricauda sp. SCSIO 64092]